MLDKNIEAAGLSHAINVQVLDYRKMPADFHHAFDAVVSIGVMEHGEFNTYIRDLRLTA